LIHRILEDLKTHGYKITLYRSSRLEIVGKRDGGQQIVLDENLKFPKSDKFNVKYKELFEQAMKIKKTRNWIIHQTNVDEPREDWENVWHAARFKLTESLLPELSRAIRKESKNKLEKSSQKDRFNKTIDKSHKLSKEGYV
jgi:hypothetical protein